MTPADRLELARLIANQCAAIQQDILNRALSGRALTDTAMRDTKRILAHLIHVIDESNDTI